MLGTAFYVLGVLFWIWAIVWIADKILAGLIYAYVWLRDGIRP